MNLKLKLIILKKFSNQADFAQVVGCHESKVSQVVCGRRKLNDDELEDWANALNCEHSILIAK